MQLLYEYGEAAPREIRAKARVRQLAGWPARVHSDLNAL